MKAEMSEHFTNRNVTATPSLNGQGAPLASKSLVEVTRLVAALRCRRMMWITPAVLGILGAVLLSAVFPPQFSATTVLLVRHDPSRSDPARAMETDVQLAASRTVAQGAINRARLPLSSTQLVSAYEVRSLSDDVLRIRARAPSAREASRRANAVAEAFLELRREVLQRHAEVSVAALEARRVAINDELLELNARIAQGSSGATPGQAPADLLARRTGLNAEAGELRRRAGDAVIGTKLLVDNSRVLDPASGDGRSTLKAVAANIAAGAVFGLAVGIGWVVVQEVITGRVRRREDVMSALGAPEVLTVGRVPATWFYRRKIRRTLRGKRGVDRTKFGWRGIARLVGCLRRSLSTGGDPRPGLVVISLESDRAAALAVASTAVDLIAEGKKVLLVDLTDGFILARLFKVAPKGGSALPLPETNSTLWLREPLEVAAADGESRSELDELRSEADVVLTLVSLSPALGAWELREWATDVVAVVTAGRTMASTLQWASHMIQAAGLHLASAVLVRASRHDDTVALPEHPLPESTAVVLPPVGT